MSKKKRPTHKIHLNSFVRNNRPQSSYFSFNFMLECSFPKRFGADGELIPSDYSHTHTPSGCGVLTGLKHSRALWEIK